MQKPKLDVLVCLLCYAGNGGVATVLPEIAVWFAKLYSKMQNDDRIGRIAVKRAGDIPLTMVRNGLVKAAKDGGFDCLMMIDSDNVPDLYDGHAPNAKPFWETSFDFLYERALKGLPSVVCAPYCGPPPHPVGGGQENVYVFHVSSDESDDKDPSKHGAVRFEAYTREHAAIMRGIQPIAAGPTGCILYTTDAFDLMPLHGMTDEEILQKHASGEISTARAKQLLRMESWFFYEFTDQYQTQKSSTEDVTNTREIQFAGIEKFGEPVVFCNWDAWAGHYKPKCVGAPQVLRIEQVSNIFAEAVRSNVSTREESVYLDLPDDFDDAPMFDEEEETEVARPKRINPEAVPDSVCFELKSLMSKIKAARNIVIGDKTGELMKAVQVEETSAICQPGVPVPSGVRLVMGLGENPDEVAMKLTPQELHAVIIREDCTDDLEETVRQWLRHLYVGQGRGYLVVVSNKPMDIDVLAETLEFEGWETLISEHGMSAMIRKEGQGNVNPYV